MIKINLELNVNNSFYEGNSHANENLAVAILSLMSGIRKESFEKSDRNNSKEKLLPDWFCKENKEYYEITLSDNSDLIKYLKKVNDKYQIDFSEDRLIKDILNAFETKNKRGYDSGIKKNLFIFSSVFMPGFLNDIINFDERETILDFVENGKKVKSNRLKNNSILFPNIYSFCKELEKNIKNSKFQKIFICMFIPDGEILIVDLSNTENEEFIKLFNSNKSLNPNYRIKDIKNINSKKIHYDIIFKNFSSGS